MVVMGEPGNQESPIDKASLLLKPVLRVSWKIILIIVIVVIIISIKPALRVRCELNVFPS